MDDLTTIRIRSVPFCPIDRSCNFRNDGMKRIKYWIDGRVNVNFLFFFDTKVNQFVGKLFFSYRRMEI